MTAPSIGAKDLLVAASIGVFGDATAAWPIYISKLPDKPDNCIMLSDSGGLAANPKWLLDYPDISVVVRGTDYGAAYSKMKAIKDKLLGLPPQQINGDNWDGVIQIGEFGFIGYDPKDRPMFSGTFRLFLEPANVAGDNRDPL